VEEARWLQSLLEACNRGIARLHELGDDADPQLLADLEQYRDQLVGRIRECSDLGTSTNEAG
jgi:hypothetical protein